MMRSSQSRSTKIMIVTRLADADADAVPTREGGCQIGSDEFLFWNAKSRSGRGIFKMNVAATVSEPPLSAKLRPAFERASGFSDELKESRIVIWLRVFPHLKAAHGIHGWPDLTMERR